MIVKVKFFLPTIVINLNNGKSDEKTNGSGKGVKEFASTDQGVRVTGPSSGSGLAPHAAAGGA